MTDDSPVLVGELNPYGVDPRYALYPLPERASGHRLQELVLGIRPRDYIRLRRFNLCTGKWSMRDARTRAAGLKEEYAASTLVLLGRKVATAFDCGHLALFARSVGVDRSIVVIPHPSGLCRVWNEPDSFDRARTLVRDACPSWAARVGL